MPWVENCGLNLSEWLDEKQKVWGFFFILHSEMLYFKPIIDNSLLLLEIKIARFILVCYSGITQAGSQVPMGGDKSSLIETK